MPHDRVRCNVIIQGVIDWLGVECYVWMRLAICLLFADYEIYIKQTL